MDQCVWLQCAGGEWGAVRREDFPGFIAELRQIGVVRVAGADPETLTIGEAMAIHDQGLDVVFDADSQSLEIDIDVAR